MSLPEELALKFLESEPCFSTLVGSPLDMQFGDLFDVQASTWWSGDSVSIVTENLSGLSMMVSSEVIDTRVTVFLTSISVMSDNLRYSDR
jgi:hypothetical protein